MSQIILNKLKSLQLAKKSKTKYWNITWLQGVFLSNLIEIKQPNNILEIGTSNGFSTLWMKLKLDENANITTIEINKERFELSQRMFKILKLTNIESINADIEKQISNFNEKFDFVFLDAKQEFYLDLIQKMEKVKLFDNNFTLVIDNVTNHSNMDDFIKYMQKNYYCEIIKIGGGFLVAKSN